MMMMMMMDLLPPPFLQSSTVWLLSTTIGVIVISSVFIAAVRRHIERLQTKKPFDDSNIPMPPNSHWLLGHLKIFQRMFDDTINDTQKKYYQPTNEYGQFSLWILSRRVLVVTNVHAVLRILHVEYNRVLPPFIGKHLCMFLG